MIMPYALALHNRCTFHSISVFVHTNIFENTFFYLHSWSPPTRSRRKSVFFINTMSIVAPPKVSNHKRSHCMAFGADFWEVHDEKQMEVIEYLTPKMMEELHSLCQKEKRTSAEIERIKFLLSFDDKEKKKYIHFESINVPLIPKSHHKKSADYELAMRIREAIIERADITFQTAKDFKKETEKKLCEATSTFEDLQNSCANKESKTRRQEELIL